ncbi:TetR/AcrR family transcriptional regulator [Amycolatopsis sp. RTGN1]|uniref:TetR/AcrR family transcriptional regulator n=1 Tax=Amycolatopsis ponsaeliensis TaxID=2992142 RepID=UPI00254DE1D7|nr:TetR/AcrR family transcriptional regulator [Amycolatopsis sp. RTGN1]
MNRSAGPGRMTRSARRDATRELILTTAERLFAEYGIEVVSNRQISEAAGQGNNAAVNYHFGTKADLVRAIMAGHNEDIERLRARHVAELGDAPGVRDWVICLVRPVTRHLASLGTPSWFGRFATQVTTNPAYRELMEADALGSRALVQTVKGLDGSLPALPAKVRAERHEMARHLLVHMLARREAVFARDLPAAQADWEQAATRLIDAIVGLWLAPVSSPA